MTPRSGGRTPSAIHRLLASLVCLQLGLPGCIVTYRDFPSPEAVERPVGGAPPPLAYQLPEFSGSARAFQSIWYAIASYWYPTLPGDPMTLVEVEQVFRKEAGARERIAVTEMPANGVFCFVDWRAKGASDVAGGVAQIVPFLLPYYSSEAGMVVRYNLYVDSSLKKEYEYTITKEGMGWILFLPFFWVNFFTVDEKDAVRATARQFLLDAERDGYL